MTSPKPADGGSKIWIVAIVVVLIAGIVAVLAARGGGGGEEAGQTGTVEVGTDASSTDTTGGSAEEGASAPALSRYDATLDEDPAIGQTIPTITGTGFGGETLTIAPDGTAKVILFVAHWCPHCQREVPRLVEHLADTPMPEGVELLTVSTSVEPGAENYPPEEWLDEEGWEAPVIADDEDGTIATTFGLSSFPYFVAVDADGEVVARASGELTTDQFDALVAQVQGS
jgi:thiol-disulfide isomerase/thioredoxin